MLKVDLDGPSLTKIIATLGPASDDAGVIGRLIEAGATIFRLNFSHGDFEAHARTLRAIREASEATGCPAAVFGDLPGPKIRVGKVESPGVEVEAGERVVFQREPIEARCEARPCRLSATYERLIDDVEPGQRILINDGAVRMLVVEKGRAEIECRVTVGGVITSGKGINLPESTITAPALTGKDRACVRWAVEHDLDYVALSFVRGEREIRALREALGEASGDVDRARGGMPIIAKIELPEAVAKLDEVTEAADAIMVARGDLGVEMDLARVPVVQKKIVATARAHGKPCIVATQMLESMIQSASPTRAEANDVANAIFDSVDAVMLSGETAVGKYPVLAVEHMRRIARQAEAYLASLPATAAPPEKLRGQRHRTAALAHGVWTVRNDLDACLIAVWSQRGGGARYLSQNEFRVPIVAVSSDSETVRRMQLLRSVLPVRMDVPRDLGDFTEKVDRLVREKGWAKEGETVILVAGGRIGTPRVTNSLAIHRVGDPETGFERR